MANTTFSGSVRSEAGFNVINKDSTSGAITETASSMSGSPDEAAKLQKELKVLTDNLSKLNKIYGGMYHAMHD